MEFQNKFNPKLKEDDTNLEQNPGEANLRDFYTPNENFNNLEKNNYDFNNNEKRFIQDGNISPAEVQNAEENKVSNEVMESTNNKIFGLYCLVHLTVFVLSIVITVFVFVLDSNLKFREISFYQDIQKNWNQKLFTSIGSSGCEKYEEYLVQDKWPGTLYGCACSTTVRQGYCGKKSRCSGVAPLDPIPIEFWRGERFCRKSDSYWQNKTYFDLDIKASSSDCKVGSRSCGIIDSVGNHLCVENSKTCPVNYIRFYDKDYFEIEIRKTLTKEDQVLQASEGVLVFSVKTLNNLKIPVDFKMSIGLPCLNPYFKNLADNYTLNFYAGRNYCLKFSDSGNETDVDSSKISRELYYDNNYEQIDIFNMEDLYKENGITKITYSLPLFPNNEYKRDINLYSRNYFGLKLSCFNDFKESKMAQELMEDFGNINHLEETSTLALRIFTILMIILIFLLVLGGIIIKEKYGKNQRPINLDRSTFCLYFAFAGVTMAIILGVFISSVVHLMNFKSISTFDSIFNNPNCVDSYGLELYQKFITDVKFVTNLGIANTIMSITCFVLLILYSLMGFYKTKESLYE